MEAGQTIPTLVLQGTSRKSKAWNCILKVGALFSDSRDLWGCIVVRDLDPTAWELVGLGEGKEVGSKESGVGWWLEVRTRQGWDRNGGAVHCPRILQRPEVEVLL